MKFSEYLEKLNKLAEDNPEMLDKSVIYSRDDEGNGFQEVGYDPSMGHFDEDREFIDVGNYDEWFSEVDPETNVICIN